MVAFALLVCLSTAQRLPATVAAGATLKVAHRDDLFFEGPAWHPATQSLFFTAHGAHHQVLRLDAEGRVHVWLAPTDFVNGMCCARDGRLLGAAVAGHRIVSFGVRPQRPADERTLLEDAHLHQPNDVCQAPNGDIYFSDPDFAQRKTSAVYLLRSGKALPVVTDMALPNGLGVSPDGRTLYVSDSHEKLWRSYPIRADGTAGAGRVFFNPDTPDRSDPDGLTLDERGNVYGTGRGGVWVVQPTGQALGRISVPEFCSNVTFGGQDGRTLYITCRGKVYSLAMSLRGVQFTR